MALYFSAPKSICNFKKARSPSFYLIDDIYFEENERKLEEINI